MSPSLEERVATLEAIEGERTKQSDEKFKVLFEKLDRLNDRLDPLVALMNQGKGWLAALLLLGSLMGWLVRELYNLFFKGHTG